MVVYRLVILISYIKVVAEIDRLMIDPVLVVVELVVHHLMVDRLVACWPRPDL